ncbi:hypothetical protein AX15_002128 [Amanita polypyramis BW_CC]|nr:hypothetical protein AX15_002128 [Amanita polypyramis BW_CC]
MSPSTTRRRSSDVDCIVPRLYLSDYACARDAEKLSDLGVTHVVSAIDYNVHLPSSIKDEHKLHIRILDGAGQNILQYLEETTKFIRAALEENETNVVLVHCQMGISRSATVVCAYLIATKNMKVEEALDFVESKRSIIHPNVGFRIQLETYAGWHELSRES